jgi:hypothetical protein
MKWLHGYSEGMLMLGTIIVIAVVAVVGFSRWFLFIFSSRDGRAARARQMVRLTVKRVAIVVVLGYAGNYLLDVRQRSHSTTGQNVPSDVDARYAASYSYLWNDKILLRLYDVQSKKLLAERTYSYLDEAKLVWTDHSLIYDTSADGDGSSETMCLKSRPTIRVGRCDAALG